MAFPVQTNYRPCSNTIIIITLVVYTCTMSMGMVQVCYGKCMCTKVVRVGCSLIEATTITSVPFQMPILKWHVCAKLSYTTGTVGNLTIHDS